MESKKPNIRGQSSSGSISGSRDFGIKVLILESLEEYLAKSTESRIDGIKNIWKLVSSGDITFSKNDIIAYHNVFKKYFSSNLKYFHFLRIKNLDVFKDFAYNEKTSFNLIKFFIYLYYSFFDCTLINQSENFDIFYGCLSFHFQFIRKNILDLLYKLYELHLITIPHIELAIKFVIKYHLEKEGNYSIIKQIYGLLKRIFESGVKRADNALLNDLLLSIIKILEEISKNNNMKFAFSKIKTMIFLLNLIRFDYITEDTRDHMINFLVFIYANRIKKKVFFYFIHSIRTILVNPQKKNQDVIKSNLTLLLSQFKFLQLINNKELEDFDSDEIKEGFVFNDKENNGFKISPITCLKENYSILLAFKYFGTKTGNSTLFSIKQGDSSFLNLSIENDKNLTMKIANVTATEEINKNQIYWLLISFTTHLFKHKISYTLVTKSNPKEKTKTVNTNTYEVTLAKVKTGDSMDIYVGKDKDEKAKEYNYFNGIIGNIFFFDRNKLDDNLNSSLYFDKNYHLIDQLSDIDQFNEYISFMLANRNIKTLINKKIETKKKDKYCFSNILFVISPRHILLSFNKGRKTKFSSHQDTNRNNFKYYFSANLSPENETTYAFAYQDIREQFISFNGVSLVVLIIEYFNNVIQEQKEEIEPSTINSM